MKSVSSVVPPKAHTYHHHPGAALFSFPTPFTAPHLPPPPPPPVVPRQAAGDITYSIVRPTAFFKSIAGQVRRRRPSAAPSPPLLPCPRRAQCPQVHCLLVLLLLGRSRLFGVVYRTAVQHDRGCEDGGSHATCGARLSSSSSHAAPMRCIKVWCMHLLLLCRALPYCTADRDREEGQPVRHVWRRQPGLLQAHQRAGPGGLHRGLRGAARQGKQGGCWGPVSSPGRGVGGGGWVALNCCSVLLLFGIRPQAGLGDPASRRLRGASWMHLPARQGKQGWWGRALQRRAQPSW